MSSIQIENEIMQLIHRIENVTTELHRLEGALRVYQELKKRGFTNLELELTQKEIKETYNDDI